MALCLIFVGIDIAKDGLDLWLEPVKRFERISNDAAGFEVGLRRLELEFRAVEFVGHLLGEPKTGE